ncbi:MAG: putative Ig domain-containing protein [Myxococcota bacterium]
MLVLACLLSGLVAGCYETQPPDPVTGLSCRAKPTKVDLVWDPAPRAVAYQVERSVDGGEMQPIAVQTETVYADQGLQNGVVHRYRVTAANAGGPAAPSLRCTVVPCARGERCEIPQNAPPEIVSTPPATTVVGASWVYPVEAIDPDGDVPVLALVDGPVGLVLDVASGVAMWTPTADQVGAATVSIRATDPDGASDTQTFVVQVEEIGPGNLPPSFTSLPVGTAIEAMPYVYQATAEDPEGQTLVFALESGPSGLSIDPSTGRVEWTPAADQTGLQSVSLSVTDPLGASGSQSFAIDVMPLGTENRPPEITSTPATQTPFGSTWIYLAQATDPEGGALVFSLPQAPAGMTIEAATGRIEWTPSAAQVGSSAVTVRATDAGGLFDEQVFSVNVVEILASPRFTSAPLLEAIEAAIYYYRPVAEDPDGGPVVISPVRLPAGMQLDAFGLLVWTPSSTQVGTQRVELLATDDEGDTAVQAYDVTVADLAEAPVITSLPRRDAEVGQPYAYDVDAFDPEGETLVFDFAAGAPAGMTIDSSTGLVAWTPADGTASSVEVAVRATDPGGLSDTQRYRIAVVAEPILLVEPSGDFFLDVGETLVLPVSSNHPEAVLSVSPALENAALGADDQWAFTPARGQEGVHVLSFKARVGDRAASSVVRVTVGAVNGPPVIDPIPPQTVAEGGSLVFSVSASDPDGDPLRFASPNTLDNAVFDELSRLFQFRPGYGQAGVYDVPFSVSDGVASAETTVQITVLESAPPPERLELVVDPPTSPTFAPSAVVSGNVVGAPGVPRTASLPPFVTGLAPTSARQGRSVDVTLTVRDLELLPDRTTVSFGAGITIDALEVLDASTARASITLAPDAALGTRRVSIDSGGLRADSVVAFLVERGAARVTGIVRDPFTGEALVGARVVVQGTANEVVTDAEGRFAIDELPEGEVRLLIGQPNFELRFVDLLLAPNQIVTLPEPIEMRALARPAVPGGTLPRAASLVSVLDRNVAGKGGGLDFEQAKLVVEDTILAVGGADLGVLDEAGNQLSPRALGRGLFSLTQLGVEAQAQALVDGDVQSLGELLNDLVDAFAWAGRIFDPKSMIGDFQRIVDESWANPQSPDSTLAILLFNEGIRLSPEPPILSAETRLNRFQSFLLVTSFLVTYGVEIEVVANEVLVARGIDPTSFAALAPESWWTRSLVAGGQGVGALADWLLPTAHAQTVPPNQPHPGQEDKLTRSLRAVWKRARTVHFAAEVVIEALTAEAIKFAAQKIMVNIAGRTAGLPGAVAATALTEVLIDGGFRTLMGKLLELWAIERSVLDFEPKAISDVRSAQFEVVNGARRFVIQFSRSDTDLAGGPGGGANPIIRGATGLDDDKFRYTYHLLKYPSCDVRDYGAPGVQLVLNASLQPVYVKDAAGNPTDQVVPSLLQFVIPPEVLDPGINFFRIATFQIYSQDDIALNAARVEHQFDDLGIPVTPLADTMLEEVGTGLAGVLSEFTPELAEIELELQRAQNAVNEGLLSVADGEWIAKSQEKRLKKIQRDIEAAVKARITNEAWDRLTAEGAPDPTTPPGRRNGIMNLIEEHRQSGGNLDDWLDPNSQIRTRAQDVMGPNAIPDDLATSAVEMSQGLNAADRARTDIDLSTTAVEKLRIPRGHSADDILFEEIADDGTIRQRRFEVALTGQLRDAETGEFREWDDVIAEQEQRVVTARRNHQVAVERVRLSVDPVNQRVLNPGGALTRLRRQWDESWVRAALARVNSVRTKVGRVKAYFRKSAIIRNTGIYALIEGVRGRARSAVNVPEIDLAKPKVGRNVDYFRSLGRGVLEVGGFVTDVIGFQNDMEDRARLLASPPSQCFQVEGESQTILGLPIETHPNYLVDGVISPLADPSNPNGGYLAINFPGTDWAPSLASAGFPSNLIATDARGNIYANNARSNFDYGGRMFRYDQVVPGGDFQLSRQLIGAVNYYSLQLQYGRPAQPVGMEVSDYLDENGITWQDLYVADVDLLSDIGTRNPRLRRIPIHLIEEFPGGYDGPARQRMASVGYVEDPRFRFTGPMDMEVGPPGFFAPNNPPRSLFFTDEERIFEVYQTAAGANGTVEVVVEVPGRRFSGLAFDEAGNLFITDYALGDVYVWPATDQDTPIVGEADFEARTWLIKTGLDQPYDIEISADEDRYWVSTSRGIEPFFMPIVAREGADIRTIRAKTLTKEYDVTRRGPVFGNSVIVGLTHEDVLDADVRLLIERRDPETNRYYWDEIEVELAMAGITILEEEL